MTQPTKRYLRIGETVEIELPYSEVCMHMKIAGKRMQATIINQWAVQLLDDNGEPFSFPILTGESGIYRDGVGQLYVYDTKD